MKTVVPEPMAAFITHRLVNKKGLISWCLYDWANSAFPTVITTFVFAAYFTKGVAADEISGTSQWGYALSLSAIAIAIVGPLLGSIADQSGRRKPWIIFFNPCFATQFFVGRRFGSAG